MKKLVVVVVIVAIVLLVAPFGVGKVAESRMNRGLDKMTEQLGYLVVADRKWTGGWFKSRQEITFEVAPAFAGAFSPKMMKEILEQQQAATGADAQDAADADVETPADATEPAEGVEGDAYDTAPSADGEPDAAEPAAPANPLRFKVFNDVLHGPVLGLSGFGVARVDTTLDLPEEVKAKIREAFGPKPALEVRTRVGFFGGATTTFTSEGRTLTPKDGDETVSYETFRMAVGYGRDFDSYDIDGKLPKFEVKGKTGNLVTVTSVTLDGDGERVKGDLYDGDFAFRIEEIDYVDAAGSGNFSVEDVHYIVTSETKDNFVTIGAKFGSGDLESAAVKSTGLEIDEIHYDFSLRRLHADSLEAIMRGMREAYSTTPADTSGEGGEAALDAALFEPLKQNGMELLKHDPEFSIDRIGVVTTDGEGMIRGLVKFVGVTPEDFSVPGGMGLIGKLDADITVEVAVKLTEKLPNGATMAGAAVDSGYVKREGEKYVCRIQFKAGELTVNGKPQAIPGLGGPPAGAMGGHDGMHPEGHPEGMEGEE